MGPVTCPRKQAIAETTLGGVLRSSSAGDITMAEVSNQTKRLVGEIAVLLCLTYVWGVRSPTVNTSSVKAGVLKQVVKADPDNADVYGNYDYIRKVFYDPAISIKAEVDYAVTSTIHVFLAPSYTFAFEKSHNPQMIGGDAGVKMFF